MKLLPKELRDNLPSLFSQEKEEDPIVYIKYFTPDSNWSWLITEGSEEDGDYTFFGLVKGFEIEWGYILLSELENSRGPMGLPIERDLYFKPDKLSIVKQREGIE